MHSCQREEPALTEADRCNWRRCRADRSAPSIQSFLPLFSTRAHRGVFLAQPPLAPRAESRSESLRLSSEFCSAALLPWAAGHLATLTKTLSLSGATVGCLWNLENGWTQAVWKWNWNKQYLPTEYSVSSLPKSLQGPIYIYIYGIYKYMYCIYLYVEICSLHLI